MKRFIAMGLLLGATNAFGQGGTTVSNMRTEWINAVPPMMGYVDETYNAPVSDPSSSPSPTPTENPEPTPTEMPPRNTEIFGNDIQLDSDHQVLTDDYDCAIPADYYTGNSDTECAYQPTDVRFAEDGSFRHNGWNLFYRIISSNIWKKITKAIKSRTYAKLDAYCGTNGGLQALTAWVANQGPSICGSGACNTKFNPSTLPTCNANCTLAASGTCGGSCDWSTVDPCSGTGATVCSFLNSGSCAAEYPVCVQSIDDFRATGGCGRL